VPDLSPQTGDLVIRKLHASAFFGTGLIRYLVDLGIDTLLLTGVSTSGCVRATAVDGVTHGYRIGIGTECVADRIDVSHSATLLDLWMKYADLLTNAELTTYLTQLARA
jgi:maleamate amidohydrolase